MKKTLISIAIFASGVAVGLFAGKKFYETKYEKLAQKEIDDVKAHFGARITPKDLTEHNMDDDTDNVRTITEADYEETRKTRHELTNKNPLTRSSLDSNPYEQAKKAYHLVGKNHASPEEFDDDGKPVEKGVDQELEDDGSFDEDGTDAAGCSESYYDDDDDPSKDPVIIDAEEYITGRPDYDKVSLYYYRYDDVLCEENEEKIDDEDFEKTVGLDCFHVLEKETAVWVRNPRLGIDYEIIGVNGSYLEAKYGAPAESPRERYLRAAENKRRGVDAE